MRGEADPKGGGLAIVAGHFLDDDGFCAQLSLVREVVFEVEVWQ